MPSSITFRTNLQDPKPGSPHSGSELRDDINRLSSLAFNRGLNPLQMIFYVKGKAIINAPDSIERIDQYDSGDCITYKVKRGKHCLCVTCHSGIEDLYYGTLDGKELSWGNAEDLFPKAERSASRMKSVLTSIEIRSIGYVPAAWGKKETLIPNHPVKFRELHQGEDYEYYGRKGCKGVDLVVQRWQGGKVWKDASPIKKEEMAQTYSLAPSTLLSGWELPADATDIFIKTEPTHVISVPNHAAAVIYTAEHSVETIQGTGDSIPADVIAFDTAGRPYKFPYAKNTASQNGLPPAYLKQSDR